MISISNALTILYYLAVALLLAHAALSWFPALRWTPFGRLVMRLVEPVLAPVRRRVRFLNITRGVALDLSGLIVFAILAVGFYVLMALLKGR